MFQLLGASATGRYTAASRIPMPCSGEERTAREVEAIRENNTPWDEKMCAEAAWGGHFEVLQWARANGCPWDTSTCSKAEERGHDHVLEWAKANGAPSVV
jgi:hypothetical protein|tara:strand:+ start:165 stop:464 length:300 start_codon:yes stop_codon:yes gene_type:complete